VHGELRGGGERCCFHSRSLRVPAAAHHGIRDDGLVGVHGDVLPSDLLLAFAAVAVERFGKPRERRFRLKIDGDASGSVRDCSRAWSVTSSSNRYAVTFDFATMQILRSSSTLPASGY